MDDPKSPVMLTKEDEANLIVEMQQGNRQAFDCLVKTFHAALKCHVQRSVWWVQPKDAEDIVQETWQEVIVKIGRSAEDGGYNSSKGRFFTWIKNYILDFKIKQFSAKEKQYTSFDYLGEDGSDEDWISNLPDPDHTYTPDIALENHYELQIEKERLRLIHLAYMELLRLLFLCGGYPHQQLAYAFSKLIYGHQSDRGIEGSPLRLSEEYGGVILKSLLPVFWELYCSSSGISENVLRESRVLLEPAELRLNLSIADLTKLDSASQEQFKLFSDKISGDTKMQFYWSNHKNGFTSAIPDWCYKVKVRIQKKLGLERQASDVEMLKTIVNNDCSEVTKTSECKHCKLRHLPPCNDHIRREKFSSELA